MEDQSRLEDTLALMRDLRRRCEWDAAQDHASLRPYLIEEAHEVDDAIRRGDDRALREELGDLLLQVLFHAVLAEERGAFAMQDVASGLVTKMRGRHPHLYGEGAKEPWERMKARRRTSIGEGLPATLPALHRAQRLQDRAAGVGFDWPTIDGPADKVREELAEVTHELMQPTVDRARVEDELGDLLFACVNLCRKAGVHAALALDGANLKFERRFAGVERLAASRGLVVAEQPLDVLDGLWDEVKAAERSAAAG
jgi:MazG family protein